MNRCTALFLAGAAVALGAGGGAVAYTTTAVHPQPTTTATAQIPSRVVRVKEVKADATAGDQTYTGVVRARYETDLAFRVGAKIVSRHVEVGQRVAAGTLLFRLDATDYRLMQKAVEADLAAAEAEVIQSAADHARQLRSVESGSGIPSDLDRARAARDVAVGRRDRAKESLTLAKNRLSYCDLVADTDGVITALPAEAGQVVTEGQIVARLAHDGEREAVISLPENQVIAAKAARATVSLWSVPGETFSATLRELSPVADPITRTYLARFTIQTPGPKVALGMTATIHLTPSGASAGYSLPLSSLLRTGVQPAVWVVNRTTGTLTLVPVEVREYRHETVILSAGVKPGQLVVTAGVQKLDPAVIVRTWEETP